MMYFGEAVNFTFHSGTKNKKFNLAHERKLKYESIT